MLLAFVVTAAAFTGFGAFVRYTNVEGLEIGKVADRDVVAETDVIYVDEQATAIRTAAERRLVPAVFVIDEAISRSAIESFLAFRTGFLALQADGLSREDLLARLNSKFPHLAVAGLLERLLGQAVPGNVLAQAESLLRSILAMGILAIPDQGLEGYHPDFLELRRRDSGPLVYEQIGLEQAVTLKTLARHLEPAARAAQLSGTVSANVVNLVTQFVVENAFFDAAHSQARADAIAASVEPVMKHIAKGEAVIRKGFIVGPTDYERLTRLRKSGVRFDTIHAASGVMLILLTFVGAAFILGGPAVDKRLDQATFLFVSVMGVGYLIAASAIAAFLPPDGSGALFLPTALCAMLAAILIGERFALFYMAFLFVGMLVVSGLATSMGLHAFSSGMVAVLLARRMDKRIDLIRAGAQLGLIQFGAVFALGLFMGRPVLGAAAMGAWSAVNGFMCAVLTLGFLPILEQMLNTPTVFRLQELSDLNAPALKRLLSVAPGTYSHSVTVAHLAESACRELGADALLARVGAYYHDIGKIEQPEYFIENQSGYNKHDDINPRLSATVLRGHVKFGSERADALGLPSPVKDIIAQHHGTSLISYFFSQAQKESPDTMADDFCYPGPLPSSKEAAVVMLADSVEAASRTLKKPTMARLDQFVRDMVMDKFSQGQLSESDITFHDLEIIINTFSRILGGHFHSRIEYPKTREGQR
jgi:hypothetical protein